MGIDPQSIINSRLGIGLALTLGRGVPPRFGYRVANFLADRIARRRNWGMVKAVRANQWVASGEKLSSKELDQAVQDTFRNSAHSIYTLYHYLHDPVAIEGLFTFNHTAQELADLQANSKEGALIVGIHLSNYDLAFLALQAIYLRSKKAMVLTLSELKGGYQWQYKMRQNKGIEIVPTTPSTLRQAIERLRSGGFVLTGLDRPIQVAKYRPHFFGRPAPLPVHHIYLALKGQAPVYVVAISSQADGTYQLLVSEPITMQPYPDRRTEIIMNAEAVLQAAENYIRPDPQQWAMTFPVWPEALDQVP